MTGKKKHNEKNKMQLKQRNDKNQKEKTEKGAPVSGRSHVTYYLRPSHSRTSHFYSEEIPVSCY